MVSQRKAWQKGILKCKPYICPTCNRDKGMLYLFPDGTMRYVCFCGSNISVAWLNDSYDFDKKKFIKSEEQVKGTGSVNESLSNPQASPSARSDNNDFKAHKSSPKVCPFCNGRKKVIEGYPPFTRVDCPKCGGSGKPS